MAKAKAIGVGFIMMMIIASKEVTEVKGDSTRMDDQDEFDKKCLDKCNHECVLNSRSTHQCGDTCHRSCSMSPPFGDKNNGM